MAPRIRSETEAEADRLFILAALRSSGNNKIAVADLAKILNDSRSEKARALALAFGKTEEEADAAARGARLSERSIERDVSIVVSRLREAQTSAAAVMLDDQIEECRRDIEGTYALDEMAIADLERSRRRQKTKTIGRAQGEGKPPVAVEVVSEREEDLPGEAALYAVLQTNIERRIRLRTEMRTLRFGKQFLPAAEGAVTVATFAQLQTGEESAKTARERAIDLYEREMASLGEAEKMLGPVSPEIAALERLRIQRQQTRVRQLREFIHFTEPGEGGQKSYELAIVQRGWSAETETEAPAR